MKLALTSENYQSGDINMKDLEKLMNQMALEKVASETGNKYLEKIAEKEGKKEGLSHGAKQTLKGMVPYAGPFLQYGGTKKEMEKLRKKHGEGKGRSNMGAFAREVGNSAKHGIGQGAVGGAAGAAAGAGVGAALSKALKGKGKGGAAMGALLGGYTGVGAGTIRGSIKGSNESLKARKEEFEGKRKIK